MRNLLATHATQLHTAACRAENGKHVTAGGIPLCVCRMRSNGNVRIWNASVHGRLWMYRHYGRFTELRGVG